MKWFFEPKKSLGIPSIGKTGKPAKHRTNKLRAILAGVIAACSMLGLSTPALAATMTPTTFTDVPSGYWGYTFVEYVYNNGYMAGVGGGLFSPDTTLNREQIIQIFYSIAGTPAVAASVTEPYDDVASRQWFYNPVRWAYSKGLAAFVQASGTHLGGGTPLPRAQIAQALWKFAQIMNWTTSAVPSTTVPFTDISSLPTAQQNAIKWCYAYSIMSGATTTTYNPTGNVSRVQMAVVVMKIVDRSAGFFPVNSVSVRKGMDTTFTGMYTAVVSPPLYQTVINTYFAQMATPYKKTWNIEFSHASYWYPTGLPSNTNLHAANVSCDTQGEGADHTKHHFQHERNWYSLYNMGDDTSDITVAFFGFKKCESATGYGLNWLATVMADSGRTGAEISRTVQHEISHLFGTNHIANNAGVNISCTSGQACIMNTGTYSLLLLDGVNIWCDNCRSAFNRTTH